jgi:hypothetical protein
MNELSVFRHVVERETGDVLDYIRLRHSVEFAVHHTHAVNRGTLETAKIQSILRFSRLQIADFQIAGNWNEFSRFAFFVEEVYLECSRGNLADVNVPRKHVFDEAATHCVVFNAHSDVEVRAIHLAIFRENVAYATRDFAAYGYTAVATFHPAITDHDILQGRAQPATIGVSS